MHLLDQEKQSNSSFFIIIDPLISYSYFLLLHERVETINAITLL